MSVLSAYSLSRMHPRSHKSAIINLSSFSFVHPLPYLNTYAATKAFNDAFSQGCA
jgi:short-subunit dehydrogenase